MNRNGRMSEDQRRFYENRVREDGFCIIEGHFSTEKLDAWRVLMIDLLEERIRAGTASPRGPHRYYVSLPFTMPWADPEIYEDPDLLSIIERLGGGDIVMPELASDTPLPGSDYQVVHRDASLRSPDLPELDPREPFQFAVNFPLVPITRDNGPFEIVPGTHLLTDEAARAMVKNGEAEARLEPLFMSVGDVMIRDVRTLHRGSPNRTDDARPMIVVGYNRRLHQRPQLRIYIPRFEFERLSERGRRLLALNPVVGTLEEATIAETYSDLAFLEPQY